MNHHQMCKICANILTSEEMNRSDKDRLGICNSCRKKVVHAEEFHKKFDLGGADDNH